MKTTRDGAINRRVFVRSGAMAMMAMALPPEFLLRPLLASERARAGKKTLICIFQRGAVDGLSMVVPFGDPAYARSRRATLIPSPASRNGGRGDVAIDLDGFFGFHPAMSELADLYDERQLAVIHAVGSPHPTRSHFDAQDFMETGTPGDKNTPDGWLNRVLQETDCADCRGRTLADGELHSADHAAGQLGMAATVPSLRGLAMGSAVPKSLDGSHPVLAIPDLARFSAESSGEHDAFERIYRTDQGDAVASAADEAFEAARVLGQLDPARYRAENGAAYPNGSFGESLRQVAQLVKADVGMEVAFADLGGWDTHANQGAAQGTLARRLQELSAGVAALHRDLGDRMEDVVILTMSEFGRTVEENGTGGTDHGHANCMLALGGAVDGGRVLGDWPGLEPEQLYQGRDLALTTDFRDVFAEVVQQHLGTPSLERVFPGYDVRSERFRGVLRTA